MSIEPRGELPIEDREEWEWSNEGLFARDLDGRLIRYDAATREELDKDVTLTIDGKEVVVKKAVVARDEQGDPRYDEDGQIIPRPTTIYDAVSRRYEKVESSRADPGLSSGDDLPEDDPFKRVAGAANNPIPILCHTTYMDPVAVCRVCVVQLARFRRRTGKVEVDDKLLPACQHRVEDGMIVDTIASPDANARVRVESAVKTLLSLLMSDHPTPCVKERRRWRLRAGGPGPSVRGGRGPVREPVGRTHSGRIITGHRRRSQRLYPLRPLRAGLRPDQGKSRHRADGQRISGANRLRSRLTHGRIVLRRLRRVLGRLPHRRLDAP